MSRTTAGLPKTENSPSSGPQGQEGGFFMREKMLVTQALDERDLLVKKISDKIDKASFVDTIKPNEDRIQAAGVEWRKSMG